MLFADGLFLVTSFSSNLSVSSLGKLVGLKDSYFISFLIFTFLSFSSVSFNIFLILKGCYFSLELCFFVYCLNISSAYVHFHSFDDLINFYILWKIAELFLKKIYKRQKI